VRDTSVVLLALDRYRGGRNVKWTLQLDRSRSDDTALEVDVLGPGLTVGF
jgi:hypothetical protein